MLDCIEAFFLDPLRGRADLQAHVRHHRTRLRSPLFKPAPSATDKQVCGVCPASNVAVCAGRVVSGCRACSAAGCRAALDRV